jgi:hypothetical protein
MRLVLQSLYGRLLTSAVLFITVALVVAGLSIGRVLEHFVMHGLDERLDAQIALLARTVRPDGKLDAGAIRDVPPFDRPGSGWAWQIDAPGGTLRSTSLGSGTMPKPLLLPPNRPMPRDFPVRPADGVAASGEMLHFRIAQIDTSGGMVTLTAAGPREIAERPLRQAIMPLLGSLMILGIGLITAILFQLRFGLRPLRALEASLAQVRRGTAREIPTQQPLELRGLVSELNALIDQNQAGLANARRHVANLAHGLKTPLAALKVKLAQSGCDGDGELGALVARMDSSVSHHLARARAASPGGPGRHTTFVAAHVNELIAALSRIHADFGRQVEVSIASDLAAACDPQDLDEMAGNLLDNAWRWASSRIRVEAVAIGAMLRLTIADMVPDWPRTRITPRSLPGDGSTSAARVMASVCQ